MRLSRIACSGVIICLAFAAFAYARKGNAFSSNGQKPQIPSAFQTPKPHQKSRPQIIQSGSNRAPETQAHPTSVPATSRTTPSIPRGSLVENYGKLPLSFEPNVGQVTGDPKGQVKFLSRGRGYSLYLTGSEAVLQLSTQSATSSHISPDKGSSLVAITEPQKPAFLRMKLVGANFSPPVTGSDKLPGITNYFIGKDPKTWRTNVPSFGRVDYKGVYPGIDLVYYGNQGLLEYDWIIEPGADPRDIRFAIGGARAMHIGPEGDLVIQIEDGEIRFRKPVVYRQQESVHLSEGKCGEPQANRQSPSTRHLLDG